MTEAESGTTSAATSCFAARFDCLIALIFVIALLSHVWMSSTTFADTYMEGPIDTTHLKGIDTIVVSIEPGPLAELTTTHFSLKDTRPVEVATQTVKAVFAQQSWLSVQSIYDHPPSVDIQTPNVLAMAFTISAQPDTIGSFGPLRTKVAVASLSMRLTYSLPDHTFGNVGISRLVSYPFVVPEDHEKFLAKISEGVRFLTSYLPSYLYCANKASDNERPCVKRFEDMHPWGAKPRPSTLY